MQFQIANWKASHTALCNRKAFYNDQICKGRSTTLNWIPIDGMYGCNKKRTVLVLLRLAKMTTPLKIGAAHNKLKPFLMKHLLFFVPTFSKIISTLWISDLTRKLKKNISWKYRCVKIRILFRNWFLPKVIEHRSC
jgi:hypothetical protein